MFNAGYKKQALAEAEKTVNAYKSKYDQTIADTTALHKNKEGAVDVLKAVEMYNFR